MFLVLFFGTSYCVAGGLFKRLFYHPLVLEGDALNNKNMECPLCNKVFPDGSNFCVYCGAKVNHEKEAIFLDADWDRKNESLEDLRDITESVKALDKQLDDGYKIFKRIVLDAEESNNERDFQNKFPEIVVIGEVTANEYYKTMISGLKFNEEFNLIERAPPENKQRLIMNFVTNIAGPIAFEEFKKRFTQQAQEREEDVYFPRGVPNAFTFGFSLRLSYLLAKMNGFFK